MPAAWAASGHQHAFPRPGPNGRCRFGQETFAGVRGNGRDAPIADLPAAFRNGEAFSDIGFLPNSSVQREQPQPGP